MDFYKITRAPRCLVLAITALLIGFSASADELLMKDGSRLIGTVVKQDGGSTIDFKTTYAGVIKVKWAEVDQVLTDEPMSLLLSNGETRSVVSAQNVEQGIATIAASGTAETFSLEEVAYVNPEPWRLGEGWSWAGRISTDLNYERGNSDKDEYEADFAMTFRWLADRVTLNGDYQREKSDEVLTDDDWRLTSRYDHFVNAKLFYGGKVGVEHDRFADLKLRTIIGPSVGYEFYEGKAMNLNIAGGPMYVKEDFYAADDDEHVAFGWQFNVDRYLIPERVQFYHRHSGLLDASDTGNLVWDSWTGLRFPIYAGIVASTEIQIEYDGDTPEDVDDTDTTYNIKLGYEW